MPVADPTVQLDAEQVRRAQQAMQESGDPFADARFHDGVWWLGEASPRAPERTAELPAPPPFDSRTVELPAPPPFDSRTVELPAPPPLESRTVELPRPFVGDRTVEMSPALLAELIGDRRRAERPVSTTVSPAVSPAPAPAPAPAIPTPVASGLSSGVLGPALELAVHSHEAWQRAWDGERTLAQLASGAEAALIAALTELALADDTACAELFESTLRDREATPSRRSVALLAWLRRDARRCLAACAELAEQREDQPLLRAAILCWRPTDASWLLARQAELTPTPFWLDILAIRHIDPGAALLERLMADADDRVAGRGLSLAKLHGDAALRKQAAARWMHDPRRALVRSAAIELALFDREPIAWMLCRQLAMTPNHARAAELVASFGGPRELELLLRRPESETPEGLWRICRSGRPMAATRAIAALRKNPRDSFARSSMGFILGQGHDTSWYFEQWAKLQPSMTDEARYVAGEALTFTAFRKGATCLDERQHEALGDELYFRSKGAIRWQGPGFAVDLIAELDAASKHELDFQAPLMAS